MEGSKGRKIREGVEGQLASLMRAVIDARTRLGRARERLRDIEHRLRDEAPGLYRQRREKALLEYIDAAGKARHARSELLRELRGRAA